VYSFASLNTWANSLAGIIERADTCAARGLHRFSDAEWWAQNTRESMVRTLPFQPPSCPLLRPLAKCRPPAAAGSPCGGFARARRLRCAALLQDEA